jgi:hypothetical protein
MAVCLFNGTGARAAPRHAPTDFVLRRRMRFASDAQKTRLQRSTGTARSRLDVVVLDERWAVGLITDRPAGIIGMPEPGWDGDEGIWLLDE